MGKNGTCFQALGGTEWGGHTGRSCKDNVLRCMGGEIRAGEKGFTGKRRGRMIGYMQDR